MTINPLNHLSFNEQVNNAKYNQRKLIICPMKSLKSELAIKKCPEVFLGTEFFQESKQIRIFFSEALKKKNRKILIYRYFSTIVWNSIILVPLAKY